MWSAIKLDPLANPHHLSQNQPTHWDTFREVERPGVEKEEIVPHYYGQSEGPCINRDHFIIKNRFSEILVKSNGFGSDSWSP